MCTGAASYTLDDFVGEGGFGQVYRVRRAGFDLVAKKFDTRFTAREVLGSTFADRLQRRAYSRMFRPMAPMRSFILWGHTGVMVHMATV